MVHNIGAMACTYSSGRIMNGNWLELNGNGTNSVYFQSVCIRSHGTGTVTMIIIMTILKLQLKTTFTWAFSLFFLVFTFQMKSFHAIFSIYSSIYSFIIYLLFIHFVVFIALSFVEFHLKIFYNILDATKCGFFVIIRIFDN